MTIGERIKQLRAAQGLSQERLAEKLNVSRSAVAKWESNGGLPEVENLRQLSLAFGISMDELVGNSADSDHSKKAETINREIEDRLYDIELTGWNDGVYGVCIIAEDQDFLYYYKYSAKARGTYGMIGRKYITSVLPAEENEPKPSGIETVSREFFRGKPVQIELAKREGLIRGLLDFRDDAYRHVVICSFEENALRLQFGGELCLADIAKIEELDDQ